MPPATGLQWKDFEGRIMTKLQYLSLIFVMMLTGCNPSDAPHGEQKAPSEKDTSPKSLQYYYLIKEVDFKGNHQLRMDNKDKIGKLSSLIRELFLDETKKIQEQKYKKPDELLDITTGDLEEIFTKNQYIEKAFKEYKVNFYRSMNNMLRENKYFAPIIGPQASCTTDPTGNNIHDANVRSLIHCMDLAFKDKKSNQDKSGQKTILFRVIRSDSGVEFDGLKYGCFNQGQQKFIEDLGFGSSTASFKAALHHHDNIAQGYNKKTYADTIYKLVQQAIIFMIEVDGNDPVFKFPKSLDTGTSVTVEEKEVLLKRGFRLEFICEPHEFLPEIPNEFEYIPNFKADAVTPTDYKSYRVIRAKLVYP